MLLQSLASYDTDASLRQKWQKIILGDIGEIIRKMEKTVHLG
jgi:hypothetical protein